MHGQSELLRRQNAERMDLERNLLDEEMDSLKRLTDDTEARRQQALQTGAQRLAAKVQGILRWRI